MTRNGNQFMTFDSQNRLRAVSVASNIILGNIYDHASRRVEKRTQSSTSTIVYDGWNPVMEIVKDNLSGSVQTNLFVWGKDIAGGWMSSSTGAGGVGGFLAAFIDNEWYFPLYDANGNITEYLDITGTSIASATYDAFGDFASTTGNITKFNFWYSTKYLDHETGLYYYGYRFYSPTLRRFFNRDPIEEDGGLNLYNFCVNDPINKWDYLGLHNIKLTVILPEIDVEYGDPILYDYLSPKKEKQSYGRVKEDFYVGYVKKENNKSPKVEERYCYPEITLTLKLETFILNPTTGQKRTPEGLKRSKLHEAHHREAFINAFNTFKGYLEPYLNKTYPIRGRQLDNEIKPIIDKIKSEWQKILNDEVNHNGDRWIKWFEQHGKDAIL